MIELDWLLLIAFVYCLLFPPFSAFTDFDSTFFDSFDFLLAVYQLYFCKTMFSWNYFSYCSLQYTLQLSLPHVTHTTPCEVQELSVPNGLANNRVFPIFPSDPLWNCCHLFYLIHVLQSPNTLLLLLVQTNGFILEQLRIRKNMFPLFLLFCSFFM